MSNEISQNFVFDLLQSKEQFPIDFEMAWSWIGYAKKQSAKNKLVNNFVRGEDFSSKCIKNPQGGRSKELIMLTIDCFKQLAMMAGTEKGKKVREYFLECEKMFKAIGSKPVKITIQQAQELNRSELAKIRIKEKIAHLQEVKNFLDQYPDCVNIVKEIFKD